MKKSNKMFLIMIGVLVILFFIVEIIYPEHENRYSAQNMVSSYRITT